MRWWKKVHFSDIKKWAVVSDVVCIRMENDNRSYWKSCIPAMAVNDGVRTNPLYDKTFMEQPACKTNKPIRPMNSQTCKIWIPDSVKKINWNVVSVKTGKFTWQSYNREFWKAAKQMNVYGETTDWNFINRQSKHMNITKQSRWTSQTYKENTLI